LAVQLAGNVWEIHRFAGSAGQAAISRAWPCPLPVNYRSPAVDQGIATNPTKDGRAKTSSEWKSAAASKPHRDHWEFAPFLRPGCRL